MSSKSQLNLFGCGKNTSVQPKQYDPKKAKCMNIIMTIILAVGVVIMGVALAYKFGAFHALLGKPIQAAWISGLAAGGVLSLIATVALLKVAYQHYNRPFDSYHMIGPSKGELKFWRAFPCLRPQKIL